MLIKQSLFWYIEIELLEKKVSVISRYIYTSEIKEVEKELIEHIQLEDFYEYKIKGNEKYINLKEQELKDVNTQSGWKEQELKDANTQLGWKEQELKDANTQLGWKEQELYLIKNSKRWRVFNLFRKNE